MIMLAQDNGLTRQCQYCNVKPADHSEKRVGSTNSESKCKMRAVLDFLTAELWTTSCQYLHISYLCHWYLNHMFFTIPSSDRQVSPSSKYKIQPFQRYSCQFFLKVCMLWFNFKLCTISIFLHFMVCWFMIARIKKNNNKLIQLEFIESQHIQPLMHPFQHLNLLKTLIKFMFC